PPPGYGEMVFGEPMPAEQEMAFADAGAPAAMPAGRSRPQRGNGRTNGDAGDGRPRERGGERLGAPRAPWAGTPRNAACPGGSGTVEINAGRTTTNRNFLVRTLPLWVAQGFAVEIVGSPNGAPLLGERHTAAYVAAIDRAVDFARSRGNAPIWLVGTSQGST